MKNFWIIGLGLLMIATLLQPFCYAAEMGFGVSDHSAWAKAYEEKAAEQGAVIAEHEKMKKDFRQKYAPNPHQPDLFTERKIQPVEEHCDAIIQDARKLQNDFLEFAKWHRMQASESEGRLAQ